MLLSVSLLRSLGAEEDILPFIYHTQGMGHNNCVKNKNFVQSAKGSMFTDLPRYSEMAPHFEVCIMEFYSLLRNQVSCEISIVFNIPAINHFNSGYYL